MAMRRAIKGLNIHEIKKMRDQKLKAEQEGGEGAKNQFGELLFGAEWLKDTILKSLFITKLFDSKLGASLFPPNLLSTTAQDFLDAIEKVNKTVSQEEVEKYKKWADEFGSQ